MKRSLVLLLAIALLLCGCSTSSLLYRNADWYLEHKIDGYASFNAGQKEMIRREVVDYMRWHRKYALPEYINFLQNLNGVAQYQGRLSAETAAGLRIQLTNLYRMSLQPAIRPTARLLSSLDSAQIRELEASFAKEIRKQKQDRLGGSLDEDLEKRADKTVSFLEWLAGDLDREQERKIRTMSRSLPFVSPMYLQNREANQHRLIALLNGRASTKEIGLFLSSWILTPDEHRDSYQQHAIETFETESDKMIVQIHALLTAKQKEHIRALTSSYIEDMRRLSAEITTTGGATGRSP